MTKEQAKMRALAIMSGQRSFSYRITITAGGRTFDLPWEAGLSVVVEELDDEGGVVASERVRILASELEEYRQGYFCESCGWRKHEPCDPPLQLEGFMCDSCRVEAAEWNPDLQQWCKAKGYHFKGEMIS